MAIDFTDPGQVTHEGERIPIDSDEKYTATRDMMTAYYAYYAVAWSADDDQQLEQRVRNGLDLYEVQRAFGEDLKTRHNITL